MTRRAYTGQAASDGVALGFFHRTDRPLTRTALPHRTSGDAAGQITEAFDAVAARLLDLSASLRAQGKDEQADIMEVNGYIAQDNDLREQTVKRAHQGLPVPVAVRQAVDTYAGTIAALDDPTLAERAADVRQVGRRVLAHLHGDIGPASDQPLVLVAHEIGAADLLEPGRTVTAAISVTGGPNSHAAIVARSLGIPFLLAVDRQLLELPDGQEILLDTDRASAVVHPDDDERTRALHAMETARTRRLALAEERHLPARTLDHHPMVLRANVATPAEARAALTAGADGIGLLRTELPFLNHPAWPTRNQHAAVLVPILRALAGQPVTVRTLDFADDKLPPFLSRLQGARIGRGLPLMLAQPDAFADQFRSLLGAGADTDLRIMIPMVAGIDELHACRRLLQAAAAEAGVPTPPLGIMVELPEAVAAADDLAREAAFLSIGSNDLTCQILGLDRRDPAATPAMAAHPAVLSAIAQVVTAAHRHHRQVSVCGDAAAHPLVTPLLIGLGCDILSVAPAALDEVRARIRRLRHDTCASLAAIALTRETPEDVWRLVEQCCLPSLP
ncbi:phosphoenolpyruvate-protein kinase (PTS system EI component) [Streptomyces sp. V4I23]|uniref:phosphoenolpyruvate--protein phosphotransferase n=1 Tax=Streptomyces sp. V4I23 TaxID=3042282 RepID=UPI0027879864|nr:putative PEP-binding protein [Streptomyces sp. V4I23]MDQ1011195.1 phosphoenolpyruvate-protein kinase (PTS system EI component) [Streptomyces sp. V4I23]